MNKIPCCLLQMPRLMSEVLEHLHADHINMARLLDLLDTQNAQREQGQSPDYSLMYDIMHYMTHFPDIYHHPLEELVFEKLASRHERSSGLIRDLRGQHKFLIENGQRFLSSIDRVLNDTVQPIQFVHLLGREYVASQRHHMDQEEVRIFPAALQYLTDGDWNHVESAMSHVTDPLFGGQVKKDYQRLFISLANTAGAAGQ